MSGDKKNIIYTSKDIEAYFSGQLSPLQRHAMEKDALDDPLLAEAMEGYEAMQGRSWKPQLIELHRHFEEERSPAKVIPLNRSTGRWWKVAAAILVIGCGATLTYVLTNNKAAEPGKGSIAKNVTAPVAPAITPVLDSTNVVANVKTPSTNRNTPAITGVSTQGPRPVLDETRNLAYEKVTTPAKDKFIFTPAQATPEKGKVSSPVATSTETGRNANLASTTNPTIPNNNAGYQTNTQAANSVNQGISGRTDDDLLKRKAESKQAPVNNNPSVNHNFIAQVVGPDNTPLPFANVSIKNEDFGTYADVRGNFRLVSSDSLINVEVRSVGYLPRVYTLRSSSSQNRIVLAEDENTAKERSVVINDDESSKRARRGVLKDSLYVNVEPADGWDNYNAYVRNNIDIPGNALKKDLHGEVEVSFKVHPNGTITDITVSQSDCADCAALAKRLVEQGPQWKIKKGLRKSSARIKVQF